MNVRSGPAEQAKTVTQSLRTRFMFVMLGLAVVPLSLLPVLAGRNASISLEQQSVAFQRQVAAGVGSEIEAAIHGRLDDLEQLVLIAHLLDHSRQEQEVLLNSLLSHERMFQEIALIEADGDELVRVARDEAVLPSDLRSRSDDAAFERSLLTARPYFGPVAFDDDAREPLMTVAYPAVDLRSGRVSAVLVASVRFKPVWSLLAEQEMTAGRDVFVINAEGIVVGHRDPTRVLREEVYLPSGSASRSVGLDGTDSVVATVDLALGDQRLTVVAEQPLRGAKLVAKGPTGRIELKVLHKSLEATLDCSRDAPRHSADRAVGGIGRTGGGRRSDGAGACHPARRDRRSRAGVRSHDRRTSANGR